ncbi:MAG: putative membrane protein [Limisphaerales bacterium]|jgi:putative membrane protein
MAAVFKTILHGFLIGVANIIPGVSGGSMALALGIYERLIAAIGNVGPGTLTAALGIAGFRDGARARFLAEWRRVDGAFLSWIATGGAVAVVVFSRVMVWLLEQWHDPTYGFFSGLILVSIWMPLKMIRRFGAAEGLSAVVGLGLVLALTFSADSEQQLTDAKRKVEMKQAQVEQTATPQTAQAQSSLGQADAKRIAFYFLCGAVAISAMVLPGVSGSFIMILLGAYFEVLQAVNDRDALVVLVFMAGCAAGLLLFTRLLKWVLSRWHDPTVAWLAGLMAGSLVALWPFRKFETVGDANVGFARVDLDWIAPPTDANTMWTLIAFLIGSGLVAAFLRYEGSKS